MSKLRKEDREKALEMLRQGISTRDIVKATGYTPGHIRQMARQNDIVIKRRGIWHCDEVIMRMYGVGKSLDEIGEEIGYSPVTVRNYLRDRGRNEEIVESDYSKLTFAEPSRVNISRVECRGRTYMDVTDIYCPR